MGLQHLDVVLTMLKAMARPVQLHGGWGFIISWLYRGIGINFEMASFPTKVPSVHAVLSFYAECGNFVILHNHPQFLFHSTKYQHAEEGSVDLRPLHYVNL